jgi:hypothetical protein
MDIFPLFCAKKEGWKGRIVVMEVYFKLGEAAEWIGKEWGKNVPELGIGSGVGDLDAI